MISKVKVDVCFLGLILEALFSSLERLERLRVAMLGQSSVEHGDGLLELALLHQCISMPGHCSASHSAHVMRYTCAELINVHGGQHSTSERAQQRSDVAQLS